MPAAQALRAFVAVTRATDSFHFSLFTFHFALARWSVDDFDVEAEGTEAVVAADHRTHGVLHPAIVEVAFASGERFHKLLHGVPRRRTHAFRAFAVDGNPLLALDDIAGVLNRILVFRHEVGIDRLADGGDSYFVHVI